MADVPEVTIVEGKPVGGTGTVKTLSVAIDAIALNSKETGGNLDAIKAAVESTNPVAVKASSRSVVIATIADNASLSDLIDLGDATLCGIVIPAGWVAAVVTLKVSADAITFFDLYDKDGEISIPAAASRAIELDPSRFVGWRHVQVRSGTTAAAVSQTGGPLSISLIAVP